MLYVLQITIIRIFGCKSRALALLDGYNALHNHSELRYGRLVVADDDMRKSCTLLFVKHNNRPVCACSAYRPSSAFPAS